MNIRIYYKLWIIILIILVSVVTACGLFRDYKPDRSTEKCSHCHGSKLEGINNIKSNCGECHDVLDPVAPENVSDTDMKEALFSEPHVHRIKNVFAGTPSCFNCHRPGSF
jgi:hypothetical protein